MLFRSKALRKSAEISGEGRLVQYKEIKETAKDRFGSEANKEYIQVCLASALYYDREQKKDEAREEAQKVTDLAAKLYSGDEEKDTETAMARLKLQATAAMIIGNEENVEAILLKHEALMKKYVRANPNYVDHTRNSFELVSFYFRIGRVDRAK